MGAMDENKEIQEIVLCLHTLSSVMVERKNTCEKLVRYCWAVNEQSMISQ
jgi:hypothetical protein